MSGKKPENARYTLWPKRVSRHNTERGELATAKYFETAKKYNISLAALANAFVLSRPFVTSSIVGATSVQQLEENIDSTNLKLSKEILKEVNDIHLLDPNPCV